ncbi:LysR family transcriptional regulator, partial [Pseudomonas sihuiensis]
YREGRRATERVRSFIDFVVARLRQHPAISEAALFHLLK